MVDEAMRKQGEDFMGEALRCWILLCRSLKGSFRGVKIQIDYAYMDKAPGCRPLRNGDRWPTIPSWRRRRGFKALKACFKGMLRSVSKAPSSRRYRPKSVKPPNGHTPPTQNSLRL